MKTRSNMPLYVVECTDITKLTDDQIDLLRCGDYLVKKTGKQRHAYKVTYKEDGQGICLTYHDASVVETVSYDYTGGHWVYNSTDKSPITPDDVDDRIEELVEGGTLDNAKPIYCHPIYCSYKRVGDDRIMTFTCLIFNNDDTPFTKVSFFEWCKSLFTAYPSASIMASGYSGKDPASRIKNEPLDDNVLYLQVSLSDTEDSVYSIFKTDISQESTNFVDGVNKIN